MHSGVRSAELRRFGYDCLQIAYSILDRRPESRVFDLREMRSFLDAAAGKAPYPASIAGELRTVSVVDAIQRSAEEQREVKV